MEANVIKCPNCGASSSNRTNCEYCGSLLVRFVDKGIDLGATSYLSNEKVYDGLIEALTQNLNRQELSASNVETLILYKSSPTVKLSRKRHGVVTIFRSGSCTWSDGDPIKLGDGNNGLVIKFSFDIHAEEKDASDERIEKQHQAFLALSSSPLFTKHTGIYMRPGSSCRFRSQEYAIDFGKDVEGAARLISEVLSKVYGIPTDAQLTYLAEGEEGDEYKKVEVEVPTEEGNKSPLFTKAENIGFWITIIWVALVVLIFVWDSSYWPTVIASVLCATPLILIDSGKLDKKFLWWSVAATFILPALFAPDQKESSTEKAEIKTEQTESNKKSDAEETPKKSRKDEILEAAYNSGAYDARGAEGTVQDLLRAGYGKDGVRGMQAQQGRLNYKEEYGEPKNAEEENLMKQYGEKYAEGFMKAMFGD